MPVILEVSGKVAPEPGAFLILILDLNLRGFTRLVSKDFFLAFKMQAPQGPSTMDKRTRFYSLHPNFY